MTWRVRKPLTVFARGASLRKRVAYSLAVVRLILVPVIFLAIYYLFAMGWIVDRIVNVDAPVATLAERASVEMLEARRAERNYFLLHDAADLEANRQALSRLEQIVATCRDLQPEERPALERIQTQVQLYRKHLEEAVLRMGELRGAPVTRVREVILAYERNLEDFLKHAPRQNRAQLLQGLHDRVGSLDAQVTATLEVDDPAFHQITVDLRAASGEVLNLAADLEKRSWNRVIKHHEETRNLVRRAEWVLGIVSGLALLLSIWVSFTLPRQVVRPLVDLKEAVDHAAGGNYEIEFDLRGESEVVALANSVRNLIAHVREKKTNSGLFPPP